MNLSRYKILFVHGLATKPPADDLLRFWKTCLIENMRIENESLARDMEAQADDLFQMCYWANAIPNHVEDDPKTQEKPVAEVVKMRRKMGDTFHVPKRAARFKAFWKDKGLDAVDIVSNVLRVKDDVAKKFLIEVKLYWDDQHIADRIRSKIADPLRTALKEKRKVAILSHSMGTFVGYDVLWRFSHHRDEEAMHRKRVRLFATMGSPLGDPMIQDLLLGKRYGYKERRGLLDNVDYWTNFAALGDIVSHDSTLADDFKTMRKQKLLKDFRDYEKLFNPYRNAKGKRNAHKSYGYLLQPKLAKTMLRFFGKLEW